MTNHIPEEQIHHLKEAMAEDSFRNKIPMLALLIFILLAIFGAYFVQLFSPRFTKMQ